MSSFIAHSIPALSVYWTPQSSQLRSRSKQWERGWLICLVLVAWAPDCDHVVPALNASAHQGARITHSLVVCLLLPVITAIALRILRVKGNEWRLYCLQLGIAALSHLVFDLLTGAMALPLLYPFSLHLFKLPFGLLPSAGKISLSNYYFYRNLGIELGILVPLFTSIHLLSRRWAIAPGAIGWRRKTAIVAMLLCSSLFIGWAASLSR